MYLFGCSRVLNSSAAAGRRSAGRIKPIKEELKEIHQLRSAIVHGGTRRPADELKKAVWNLRKWVRQAIVATLRMNWDQERIIRAVIDQRLRNENRELVPEYDPY